MLEYLIKVAPDVRLREMTQLTSGNIKIISMQQPINHALHYIATFIRRQHSWDHMLTIYTASPKQIHRLGETKKTATGS